MAKWVLIEFIAITKNIKINNPKLEYSNFVNPTLDFYLNIDQNEIVDQIEILVKLKWENVNGTTLKSNGIIRLKPQRSDIDWNNLKLLDPYNFEPVNDEKLLIGRDGILNRIYPKLTGKRISSFFLLGQKRVGKTSIAKTILNKIKHEQKGAILIYRETGDFQSSNSSKTINELGSIICEVIKLSNPKYSQLIVPKFQGSLNRLSGFIDNVHIINPTQKLIIVLDEFDEIDSELYLKGSVGNSFFLTLRALSNKELVSFILVGGEKMRIILDSQGEQINKFDSIEVDYFESDTLYTDYSELVKSPVPEFEFEDSAIELLHKYTAGNPYFTKIICNEIFNNCLEENDSHITKQETYRATNYAMAQAKPNSFMHFWADGIKGKKEKEEIITMERKKFLLGYAKALINNTKVTKSVLFDSCRYRGLDDAKSESILNEFIDRNIFLEKNDSYRILVEYFEKWLVGYGIEQILTSFSDDERIQQYQREEEEARVKTKEIQNLLSMWGPYKGKKINLETFRRWLEQFDDEFEQRMAFKLAQNIKVYDIVEVDTKLNTLFRRIQKTIKSLVGAKVIYAGDKTGKQLQKLKKNNLIISYLDGPGKSGAFYAKRFADVNNILSKLVVEQSEIYNTLNNTEYNIDAIIFIDDFIGTGNSIKNNLGDFLTEHSEYLSSFKNLSIHIATIIGYNESKYLIEKSFRDIFSQMYFYIEDLLTETNKIFSDKSKLFSSFAEKERIKLLAHTYGSKLSREHPLGYGDCQSLIVLPDTCPNNTLPIFWKETENWYPIFKRDTN